MPMSPPLAFVLELMSSTASLSGPLLAHNLTTKNQLILPCVSRYNSLMETTLVSSPTNQGVTMAKGPKGPKMPRPKGGKGGGY